MLDMKALREGAARKDLYIVGAPDGTLEELIERVPMRQTKPLDAKLREKIQATIARVLEYETGVEPWIETSRSLGTSDDGTGASFQIEMMLSRYTDDLVVTIIGTVSVP